MLNWLRIIFFSLVVLGAGMLITLASGGSNSADFERYFPVLLVINIFATVSLLAFVLAIVYRLLRRLKNGVFGSKMTAKLALTMSAAAVVPCLLIYMVSNQFIGRSIDSWFDVRIEQALDSGVTFSSEIIDREQRNLRQTALRIASIILTTKSDARPAALARMRETTNAASAIVFSPTGEILLSSFSPTAATIVDRPTVEQLEKSAASNGIYMLEGDQLESDDVLRIRALVPLEMTTSLKPSSFLQLTQLIPREYASHTFDLIQGYRNYQELVLARSGLRNIYGVTLTLTMVLAVLCAVTLALSLARTITAPVLQLARGTRKVAEGDLRPIKEFAGKSEINALTQSFNVMIAQVAEAQDTIRRQKIQAEEARANLALILENLSSGVIVTDERLSVTLTNGAASRILRTDGLSAGMPLASIAPAFSRALTEKIQVADKDQDIRFELELPHHGVETATFLFIRAARLDLEAGRRGWVIVFDDISTVLEAQRAVAWGEVARRLAHEIKNPLTPIRLATERLEMKLADKLNEKDAALLHRTSRTIITQVDAMKQMVNDFRDYAKLPAAVLEPMDLNAFFRELEEFYTTAGTPLKVSLEEGLPPVSGDAGQLRQVVHNIVSNAVDATAGLRQPEIRITTVGVRRPDGKIEAVRVVVEDNGPGFSANILSCAFEPYTTTKPTGTGLGLPMVKKIIEEHHGRISIGNRTDLRGAVLGARIVIVLPLSQAATSQDAAPGKIPNMLG